MKRLFAISGLVLIVLVLLAVTKPPQKPPPETKPVVEDVQVIEVSPAVIDTYVRDNISSLSPVAATMGGTFYVTKVASNAGVGTVEYEDGHMSYTADFTYDRYKVGEPTLETFVVRE